MGTGEIDFFKIMVQSIEPEHSFIQMFWSSGAYLGEAIEAVLRACARLEIKNPIAMELDCVDPDSVPDGALHDEESNVFYAQSRYSFPTEKTFIAPFGIIASGDGGDHDYEQIREGFSLQKTEEGIYEIEAVIERDNLLTTFFELVKSLPSIRVFWIKIAAEWDEVGREQFWTNEDLNTFELIAGFLNNNFDDTVANGHVALTVYSDEGQTNLSIDTHKTVVVMATTSKMQQSMAVTLRQLGFAELSEFYSLRYNYHHWHYRPAQSKSRTKLVATLQQSGFKLWKHQEAEE